MIINNNKHILKKFVGWSTVCRDCHNLQFFSHNYKVYYSNFDTSNKKLFNNFPNLAKQKII